MENHIVAKSFFVARFQFCCIFFCQLHLILITKHMSRQASHQIRSVIVVQCCAPLVLSIIISFQFCFTIQFHSQFQLCCFHDFREFSYDCQQVYACDRWESGSSEYYCIYISIVYALRIVLRLQYRVSSRSLMHARIHSKVMGFL